MDKHLYIIGNGFDIHHGINSSYLNFRDWMQMQNSDVIEDFENAYGECDEEWWADFENKLASLDIFLDGLSKFYLFLNGNHRCTTNLNEVLVESY